MEILVDPKQEDDKEKRDIFHFNCVIVIGPCSWGTKTLKTPSVLQDLLHSLFYSDVSRTAIKRSTEWDPRAETAAMLF